MRFFAVIALTGIFCLPHSQIAQSAEIEVVDNSVFVETDAYAVQFMERAMFFAKGGTNEIT